MHLNSQTDEDQLNVCIEWIRTSLEQHMKVTVLVKEPADIKDLVENAVAKKKKRLWDNRIRTKQEIHDELYADIQSKIQQSQEEKDQKLSLELLTASKKLYETAVDYDEPSQKIMIYYYLVILSLQMEEVEAIYSPLQEGLLVMLSSPEKQIEFGVQYRYILQNKIHQNLMKGQLQDQQLQTVLELYQNALIFNDILSDQQKVSIQIKLQISQIFQNLNDVDNTINTWLETLALIENLPNPQDSIIDKKFILYNLGQTYYEMKKEDEALKYWLRTIEILKKEYEEKLLEQNAKILSQDGKVHDDKDEILLKDQEETKQYAQLQNYVGTIYYHKKDYILAIEHMELAIQIFILVHGPNDIIVANKYNSLGEAYKYKLKNNHLRSAQNFDSALEAFARSLELKQVKFKLNPNKSQSLTLNNIALTLQSMKKYDLAVRSFTNTLTYYEQTGVYESMLKGEGALAKASTSHSLAESYKGLKELDGARQHFETAFEIRLDQLGMIHKATQSSAIQLAAVQFQSGDFDEALTTFKLILDSQIKAYGEDSMIVAQTRNNISSVLTSQKKYDEALIYLQLTITIMESQLKPDDPNLIKANAQKTQLLLNINK